MLPLIERTGMALRSDVLNTDEFIMDFSSIMKEVAIRQQENIGITRINLILPETGIYSERASNINAILNYINQTNIVKYNINIDIVKHDYESNTEKFREIVNNLLQQGEQFFVTLENSNESKVWVDLTKDCDVTTPGCPMMFSCSSTTSIEGRKDNLVRLTPDDSAMFESFRFTLSKIFNEEEEDDEVVVEDDVIEDETEDDINAVKDNVIDEQYALVYEDTIFGNSIKDLFTEAYATILAVESTDLDGIEQIKDELRDGIIFAGKSEPIMDIYHDLYAYNSDAKYIFYDTTRSFDAENTYFFNYSGELTNSNRSRYQLIRNIGFNLTPDELALIDIINALSYMSVVKKQNTRNVMDIITSYGKYLGPFHFNSKGDRDNYYFACFHQEGTRRIPINLVEIVDTLLFEGETLYSLQSHDDLDREQVHIMLPEDFNDDEQAPAQEAVLIDIFGATHDIDYTNLHNMIVSVTDTIYIEREKDIILIAPSLGGGSPSTTIYIEKDEPEYLGLKFFGKVARRIRAAAKKVAAKVKRGAKKAAAAAKKAAQKAAKKAAQIAKATKKAVKKAADTAKKAAIRIRDKALKAAKVAADVAKKAVKTVVYVVKNAVVSTIETAKFISKNVGKMSLAELANEVTERTLKGVQNAADQIVEGANTLIADSLNKLLELVAGDLTAIIGPAVNLLGRIISNPVFAWIVEKFINIFANQAEKDSKGAEGVAEKVTDGLGEKKLPGFFEKAFAFILDKGQNIIQPFFSVLRKVFGKLKEFASMLTSLIKKFILDSSIVKKLIAHAELVLDFWKERITDLFTELANIIIPIGEDLIAGLFPFVEKAISYLVDTIEAYRPVLEKLVKIIVKVIKTVNWDIVANAVKSMSSMFKRLPELLGFITKKDGEAEEDKPEGNSIVDTIAENISNLLGVIDFNVVNKNLQEISDFMAEIASFLKTYVSAILNFVKDMVLKVFDVIAKPAMDMFKRIFEVLTPSIKSFIEDIMPIVKDFFSTAKDIFAMVKDAFIPLIASLKASGTMTQMETIFKTIGGWISDLANLGQESIETVVEGINGTSKAASDQLDMDLLKSIIATLVEIVQTIFTVVSEIFKVLEAVITFIKDIISVDDIGQLLTIVFEKVGAFMKGNGNDIMKKMMKVVMNVVSHVVKIIVDAAKKLFNDIVAEFSRVLEPLLSNVLGDDGIDILDFFDEMKDVIFSVGTALLEVTSVIFKALSNIIIIGITIIEKIVTICFPYLIGIIASIKQIVGGILRVFNIIVDYVVTILSVASTFVEGFVTNLMNGIRSNLEEDPDSSDALAPIATITDKDNWNQLTTEFGGSDGDKDALENVRGNLSDFFVKTEIAPAA